MPQFILASTAEQLTAGLIKIISDSPDCIRTTNEWTLVFSLLAATASRDLAAKLSFEWLRQLAFGSSTNRLTAENYVAFVNTLNSYATAASVKEGKPDVRLGEDSVVDRGRQALDIIRDSQLQAEKLIKESQLPFTQGKSRLQHIFDIDLTSTSLGNFLATGSVCLCAAMRK